MTTACDSSLPSVANLSTALVLAKPAPLATGEDPATYDDLLARVVAAVKPNGVIEDLCVRDVADDSWEVLRLRRYKAGYLVACRRDGMAIVLAGLGETMSHTLAKNWAAGEPAALGDVRARMENAGLGDDAVMGSAFAKHINEFDRIERLIGAAMARRAATLREDRPASDGARRATRRRNADGRGRGCRVHGRGVGASGRRPRRRESRMSSERLRQANRANAARSTGPRSRAGRATAARNARRYGLSLPVMADAALAPEVAALARAIAGEGAGGARRAAASRIAEAQIDLARIRRVRLAVTERLLAGAGVTGELVRIDRYERRALSRRKAAIRDFDAAGWEELKLEVVK